ncbi:pyruvate, phosphate dikinase [Alphaproteobacteria bacterium]|nr:pyruvate, phosphate dikinase [Alphaproteobacteria bacterium]
MSDSKLVYAFGNGFADGGAELSALLGGKGANLAEMCLLGLPVPAGFTLTTDICTHFNTHEERFPDGLDAAVMAAIDTVAKEQGKGFGDASNPLLVSVRSGSRASMPGMMDTVLNLGLNDVTVEALATATKDARFAWDSYRRFLQMYGDVVMGVAHDFFEEIIDDYKYENSLSDDAAFEAEDWRDVCGRFRKIIQTEAGDEFPQDPYEQLWGAIRAVFKSWNNRRAITYRRLQNIPDDWGTAVNVQAMVFGNLGQTSATGVAFTRNPSNGEKEIYGEYLLNAQGEDVVAGIRTPLYLSKQARVNAGLEELSLEEEMPQNYGELLNVFETLERHFRDMQDVEFTIEQGRLFVLQTRNGKRAVKAGLKIAVALSQEGLITPDDAVLRIDPMALEQLLHPTLDPRIQSEELTRGLPASPGAASGAVVFSPDRAEAEAAQGHDVVLLRMETSPEDIHGMYAAKAILTSRGGMTSHAAVVARGLGRPCVSGAGAIQIDYAARQATIGKTVVREGDIITVDGTSGRVLKGRAPTLEPELTGDFGVLMEWADAHRGLAVRANAETPAEAERARRFGAQGIGLVRTEHMFFDAKRIFDMRCLILATEDAHRDAALARLQPEQQADFASLFEIMSGLPVTIRLLDPPLHEFLPKPSDDLTALSTALGVSEDALRVRIIALEETNPMLGHRGSRLAVTTPEIYQMQLRAIFGAMKDQQGEPAQVEIMFPLVIDAGELGYLCELAHTLAADMQAANGQAPSFTLGSMIEVPRAALLADELAAHAEFFSFGTNDLTQTTMGLSRDDAGKYLSRYVEKGFLPNDPFVSIDEIGVGALVTLAVTKARQARPNIKLGICGEHGGDPQSIDFCQRLGLDYVSCSPYRVPIARLAAAQAAIRQSL